MATDHGVPINVCTSAKKAGASAASGVFSLSFEQSPKLARLQRGDAHALAVDRSDPADCVADG